ncbi:putative metal-binding motif-containing protein [Candidatus Micrarchaeota archaeon]|nr:putative metal-binding motif-containing protein [Candidatus Micrarchaeota archaeon]
MAVYIVVLIFALAYVTLNSFFSSPVGFPTEATAENECIPQNELCNGLDDDCDGIIDEGNTCIKQGSVAENEF